MSKRASGRRTGGLVGERESIAGRRRAGLIDNEIDKYRATSGRKHRRNMSSTDHNHVTDIILTNKQTDIPHAAALVLRSTSNRTVAVPRTRSSFDDRSFAAAGPRLWNSLPTNLRQMTSYGPFRRHLKAHLLLARLMGQYCFARWRLSSFSVSIVCRRL